MKKLLDLLDELTFLNTILNRQIAKEDFEAAYSTAKTISIKISTLLEELYLQMLKGESP